MYQVQAYAILFTISQQKGRHINPNKFHLTFLLKYLETLGMKNAKLYEIGWHHAF